MKEKEKHIVIIAEAGVNHNGSAELALEMVDVAAACGADMIKFQSFRAASLASKRAPQAAYQKGKTSENGQLEMLQKLELNEEAHYRIMQRCREKGIQFLSSPFDLESIDLLEKMGCAVIKIPSGEITNLPYLKRVAKTNASLILSTGMSTMTEIEAAIRILQAAGLSEEKISLLHCTSEYPCPFDEVNLNAILTLRETFGFPAGYSDHTSGIEISLAAAALGAVIIEKHFTTDRSLPGPDHEASVEPHELKALVAGVRNIERAMGNGIKEPTASELRNLIPARKSIFTKTKLNAGDILTEEHLVMMRPGNGISPMQLPLITGKKLRHDLPEGHMLEMDDLTE